MADNKDRFIFIIGNSRSGTTMMGRILGNHADVFTFNELHFFEEMWAHSDKGKVIPSSKGTKILSQLICLQRDGYFSNCSSKSKAYQNEAKNIIEHTDTNLTALDIFKIFLCYETSKNRKLIPCEQTPHNVFYIKEIVEFFPNARIIHMMRDPRDILLSQKKRWKRRSLSGNRVPLKQSIRYWINYHPITISKLWNSAIRAADRYAKNSQVLSIRFEDLVMDPEKYLMQVCNFIGISYDKKMLEVPQIGSSSSYDNIDIKGLNREKAGTWQKGGLNTTELYIAQNITKYFMRKYGYEISKFDLNPILLILYYALFPIKLFMALLLSLGRMKNIKDIIKRRLK